MWCSGLWGGPLALTVARGEFTSSAWGFGWGSGGVKPAWPASRRDRPPPRPRRQQTAEDPKTLGQLGRPEPCARRPSGRVRVGGWIVDGRTLLVSAPRRRRHRVGARRERAKTPSREALLPLLRGRGTEV